MESVPSASFYLSSETYPISHTLPNTLDLECILSTSDRPFRPSHHPSRWLFSKPYSLTFRRELTLLIAPDLERVFVLSTLIQIVHLVKLLG